MLALLLLRNICLLLPYSLSLPPLLSSFLLSLTCPRTNVCPNDSPLEMNRLMLLIYTFPPSTFVSTSAYSTLFPFSYRICSSLPFLPCSVFRVGRDFFRFSLTNILNCSSLLFSYIELGLPSRSSLNRAFPFSSLKLTLNFSSFFLLNFLLA